MKQIKRIIFAGFMFISTLSYSAFPAVAQVSPEIIATTQELKELSKIGNGLYFEETESGTVIKDKTGETQYGLQYDMTGNLYFITEESGMIRSSKNENGIYFDENGCYVNPAMVDAEKHKELSHRFESGETLKFENQEKLLDFLEYYSVQYRCLDDASDFTVINYGNGTKEITIPENRKYDREALIQKVIMEFGRLEGNRELEKIIDGCQKVTNSITYDLVYINEDLEKSLTDKRGVCRHYSKILKILLDDAGIQNEIMVGTYNGGAHMWIRCLINGEWCYVDPTAAKQIWWNYADMPYETFISSYMPMRAISIK